MTYRIRQLTNYLLTLKSKHRCRLVRATATKEQEKPIQGKWSPAAFFFRFVKILTSFHKNESTRILNRLLSPKPRKANLNGATTRLHTPPKASEIATYSFIFVQIQTSFQGNSITNRSRRPQSAKPENFGSKITATHCQAPLEALRNATNMCHHQYSRAHTCQHYSRTSP